MQDCSKCFSIVHGEENLGKILIFCLLFVLEILKMVFTPRKLILMAQNDFVFVMHIPCHVILKYDSLSHEFSMSGIFSPPYSIWPFMCPLHVQILPFF